MMPPPRSQHCPQKTREAPQHCSPQHPVTVGAPILECPAPPHGTATCSFFLDPLVFPPLCLRRRACHCRGSPIGVYHNGIPETSYLLNSESLGALTVNRSTHARLGSMGRVPAIPSPGAFLKIVFLAVEWNKRRVCLTDFFSGPVVAAVAASVPLPFPTPPPPCETLRPLRHAAISSHPAQYTSTPARYPKGIAILLLETP